MLSASVHQSIHLSQQISLPIITQTSFNLFLFLFAICMIWLTYIWKPKGKIILKNHNSGCPSSKVPMSLMHRRTSLLGYHGVSVIPLFSFDYFTIRTFMSGYMYVCMDVWKSTLNVCMYVLLIHFFFFDTLCLSVENNRLRFPSISLHFVNNESNRKFLWKTSRFEWAP